MLLECAIPADHITHHESQCDIANVFWNGHQCNGFSLWVFQDSNHKPFQRQQNQCYKYDKIRLNKRAKVVNCHFVEVYVTNLHETTSFSLPETIPAINTVEMTKKF